MVTAGSEPPTHRHRAHVNLNEVMVRVPRREVFGAEPGGAGLNSPPLAITFTNGNTWQLEVPRPSKKGAQEDVRDLGAGSG